MPALQFYFARLLNFQQLLRGAAVLTAGLLIFFHTIQGAGNHLDYGFSADGKTSFGFPGATGNPATSVIVQPDGKIIAAGASAVNSVGDFSISRLNPNGTLDGGFDGDGRTTVDFGGNDDPIYAVTLQPDGKIVAVGFTKIPNSSFFDFAVARLSADGSPDLTFDGDGRATIDFLGIDVAYAVTVQADGKIVVAGSSSIAGNGNFGLARLNADGSPDTTFDTDGKISTDFNSGADYAAGVAVLPDGKIIAGGTAFAGSHLGFALVRYTANGALDATFDGDGKISTGFGADAQAVAFERMADGRLVLAGYTNNLSGSLAESNDLIAPTIAALARYNPDGTPDASFDGDGKAAVDIDGNSFHIIRNIAVAPNGDILAACPLSGVAPGSGFSVVRFLSSGSLDKSFGAGGRVNTIFGNASPTVNDVALQTDGKIVAVGNTATPGDVAVARYKTVGIAASSDFNGDGRADIAVYRRETGVWYIFNQTANTFEFFNFGLPDDTPAPGDYDGDGKTDAAVYRSATGTWWVRRSSDPANFLVVQFGLRTDRIVPADYDGDGKTDFGVYRRSEGNWYLLQSTAGFAVVRFGAPAPDPSADELGSILPDKPVPADYDGDGLTDIAVFRPADGTWWIRQSAFGTVRVARFGRDNDFPVPADYDGDGRAETAVFRFSEGRWYLDQTGGGGVRIVNWGTLDDLPSPADYDGDGRTDIAVARIAVRSLAENNPKNEAVPSDADGSWWVLRSSNTVPLVTNWGVQGDTSISFAYFSR